MYEVPKILGDDGAGPPPWEGSVDDALERRYFPHMCYRTKFRRSGSNRLGTGRGFQNSAELGPRSPLELGRG